MNPVQPSAQQAAMWAKLDETEPVRVVIGGPEEGPDVTPCPALVARAAGVVHVAYELDEIEVAALAQGGTLWLTTWGPLPVHQLAVEKPQPGRRRQLGPLTDDGEWTGETP